MMGSQEAGLEVGLGFKAAGELNEARALAGVEALKAVD